MTAAKKKKAPVKKSSTLKRKAPASDNKKAVKLSNDDADTVTAAESAVSSKQLELGVLREQFLASEAKLAQDIGAARQQFQAVVKTMADKNDIDLNAEKWGFNIDSMTFSIIPNA